MRGLWITAVVAAGAPALMADELYVSLPDQNEIRRLDTDTGMLHEWATDVGTPLYGEFGEDGFMYVGDFGGGNVYQIDMTGAKVALDTAGLVTNPLSVAVDPVTGWVLTGCATQQHVVAIDPTGANAPYVFADNSSGLFMVPGGIAFVDDDVYMTDHGTHNLLKIDRTGHVEQWIDGPAMGMNVPAGLEADASGNLFVAVYLNNQIVRFDIEERTWEVFCDDPMLQWPNDVELSKDGGLLVTCELGQRLVYVDALGRASEVASDTAVGGWLGVAYPGMNRDSGGSIDNIGQGSAGSGGFVPRLRGHFTPAPGVELGYTVDRGMGGARGLLMYGIAQTDLDFAGGNLYLDLGQFWGFFPFKLSGAAAGEGRKDWRFLHPDDESMANITFYMQALIFDEGANQWGMTLTNGREIHFGSLD